jgi:thioredoxin 1
MAAHDLSDATRESATEPISIENQDDLDELVATADIVLADFYADWCGPCKMIEPTLETIAAETPATIAKIDVDTNQQLAATFGVRGVPTLILFANGSQAEKLVGVQSQDQLQSLITNYSN